MIGEQKTPRDPKNRDHLRGGTEHLDVVPTVGEKLASGGTPATAAPSGGVHPPPPGKSGPPMTGEESAFKEPKEHTPTTEKGPGGKRAKKP